MTIRRAVVDCHPLRDAQVRAPREAPGGGDGALVALQGEAILLAAADAVAPSVSLRSFSREEIADAGARLASD